MRNLPALLLPMLLAACALGPSPKPGVAPAGAIAGFAGQSAATSADPAAAQWWQLYDDPVLADLVRQALAANTDLRVASANLARARASLSEARTARLPATSVSGSGVQTRRVILLPTGAANFTTDFYQLGLDASYELDLYGRVTRATQAAKRDALAAAADRDAAMVAVAAETTRSYADACGLAGQLAVAQRSLKIQQDSFSVVEKRLAVGRDAPADAARARAQLANVEASLPDLAAGRQGALFRLAVLTGKLPQQVDARAAACTAPPRLAQPIPVGDGAQLLARRPDVRAADLRFQAATARIGVAKADYFPRIAIGGQLSGQGVNPGDVVSNTGFGYSIGPLISWSFPNLFGVGARVKQARAAEMAARASFDGVVLNALKETETTLSDYSAVLARNAALQRSRDASAEAARLVRLRYQAGKDGFLALLDAERSLATADAQLAASQTALTTAQVALFKALGGGWQPDAAPAAPAP